MARNAIPAILNIDLNQTTKKNPAMYTLERLHADLGGKIKDNKREAKRLAQAMLHIEAVLKMLQPGYSVRSIAVPGRKPNPWFRRGTCSQKTAYNSALSTTKNRPPGGSSLSGGYWCSRPWIYCY